MAKKNNERRNQILKGAGIAAGGLGALGVGAYALRKGKFGKPKTKLSQSSPASPKPTRPEPKPASKVVEEVSSKAEPISVSAEPANPLSSQAASKSLPSYMRRSSKGKIHRVSKNKLKRRREQQNRPKRDERFMRGTTKAENTEIIKTRKSTLRKLSKTLKKEGRPDTFLESLGEAEALSYPKAKDMEDLRKRRWQKAESLETKKLANEALRRNIYLNKHPQTINFNMYRPKSQYTRYASDYDNYEFGFNPFRKKSLIKIAPITGKKKLPGASKTPITDKPMARMGNRNKRPNPLAASREDDLSKSVIGRRRTAGANYSKMNKAPQYSSPGGRGINAGYAKPKKPINMNPNYRMGRKR